MINCSGCGNPTVARQVPKGPKGPWTAYECRSGCFKPGTQYKLTTNPPREQQVQAAQQASNANPSDSTALLREILVTVRSLHALVNRHVTLKDDPLEIQVGKVEEGRPF